MSPQRDSIGNLRDLIDFAETEGIPIRLENYIHFPQELSLRNLPADAKKQHGREIQNLIQDCRQRSLESQAQQLDRLLAFMNLPSDI